MLGIPVLYPKAHFYYRANKESQTRKIDWNIYSLDKAIVFTKLALRNRQASPNDVMKAYNKKILYNGGKNE
jgi:hypothetical protein